MKPLTEIHLFGSLRKTFKNHNGRPVQLELEGSMSIMDILRDLTIDLDAIQLAMINYKAVSKDSAVYPGDRLSLFPKEYPIFADWKDFRLR